MGDWKTYCRGERDVKVERDVVVLQLARERMQSVAIVETTDAFELTSLVAKYATIRPIADFPLHMWKRNRSAQLVGFRLDKKGRVVGESWIPKIGLTREEFLGHLRHLAAECDLYEFQLTGRDRG